MPETIPAMFARQAAALAEQPLFLQKRVSIYEPITWRQAAEDVQALSAFLLQHQVNAGDRVLILSENRPEWGIADLAIQSVGAWSVPIYPSLTAQDMQTIGRDCEPVAAVASTPDQVKKLLDVRQHLPSLRMIIHVEPITPGQTGVTAWGEALAKGKELVPRLSELMDHRRGRIRPEDTATLIYTSGTTGEPKGVMLSHGNFLSNVEACLKAAPITGSDSHLSFLPLCHVFERMAGWYLMLAVGARVAYAENMDTVPANMVETRPTIMLGVPRFFEKLYAKIQEGVRQAPRGKRRLAEWALTVGARASSRLQAGRALPVLLGLQWWVADRLVFRKLKAKLGGRLRFFISGGAPLPKAIGEFFYGVGIAILEGYGLTETSPVIAVNRLPTPRFGSVGRTLEGVEVRFAEDGELLTRGPHIMQGYYKQPDATAKAIVDGWFHTGDIGHIDERGDVFITDRKKDLIKTAGGKYIAPQKLENLFVCDPYISQAFVFGDRQRYCVALIVPDPNALRRHAQKQEIPGGSMQELVREPRIIDFYWSRVQAQQQGLAEFERVKRVALLDQEFSQAAGELTPTLKAKRNIIAKRYETLLQGLYQTPSA